jgi:hypothetical protein
MRLRQFQRQRSIEQDKLLSATVRKHLNADALFKTVTSSFEQVSETRTGKPGISMKNALMSAFAIFSLKDPALLAFEQRGSQISNQSGSDSLRLEQRVPIALPRAICKLIRLIWGRSTST